VMAVVVTVVFCHVFSDFCNDFNRANGSDLGVCPGRNSAVDLALQSSVLGELMDAAVNESLNELEVYDVIDSKFRIRVDIVRVVLLVHGVEYSEIFCTRPHMNLDMRTHTIFQSGLDTDI
jgi:hypothetical protein